MSQLTAHIYETILEPLLHHWKSRLSSWVENGEAGLTLDVCCGTGKQCRLLAEHSPTIGLDLDVNMLKFAKSRAPDISFVCADAARLPFKSGVFRYVTISLALHDKPEVIRRSMIRGAIELLSFGGELLLFDFEQPASTKKKIGYALIYLIERMAGQEHFANSREFLKAGGLTRFLQRCGVSATRQASGTWASLTLLSAAPKTH